MLADLLPHLRCPVCHRGLAGRAGGLGCARGHTFDLARHGYVNLAAGRPTHSGDTAGMIAARTALLASGSYDFLAAALATAASRYGSGGLVVDIGGGTGYHLARVLDALPTALGLTVDVSKPALRRAARAHPRAGAVLADVWRELPLPDHTATVLLDVFAPRNGRELHRVLAPGGALLVATPTPGHLAELTAALPATGHLRLLAVDPAKPERLAASLERWFRPTATTTHTRRLRLPRPLVHALVEMGPSAAHTEPAALAAAVASLPEPLPVTASVRLTHYAPRAPEPAGRLR
jgi:23S rRNA (guanine745-N1)-methyltransferase